MPKSPRSNVNLKQCVAKCMASGGSHLVIPSSATDVNAFTGKC